MTRRTPEQMKVKDKKIPVSCRIKESTHALLEKRSKKAGLSLSRLLEEVIEDYCVWLRQQK